MSPFSKSTRWVLPAPPLENFGSSGIASFDHGFQVRVGLSPDGRVLYVAETETARLWAFDIEAPGKVRKAPHPSPHGGRLVCGLGGYQRFDSLAVEASGNIAVATLVAGAISVIAPDGRLLRQVAFPDPHTTNIC